jgi:hypothetical protein
MVSSAILARIFWRLTGVKKTGLPIVNTISKMAKNSHAHSELRMSTQDRLVLGVLDTEVEIVAIGRDLLNMRRPRDVFVSPGDVLREKYLLAGLPHYSAL